MTPSKKQEQDWNQELKDYEMIVEDGILKGCLVYHETVEQFISTQIQTAKQEGHDEGFAAACKAIRQLKAFRGRFNIDDDCCKSAKQEAIDEIGEIVEGKRPENPLKCCGIVIQEFCDDLLSKIDRV